jgi:gentisate 1,2-dioxygenase
MVDTLQPSIQESLAALHERMAGWSLAGHWQPRRELAPLEPRLWRWEEIYTCLTEAGEVVKLGEDTGRRTVQLINPALIQEKATTRTIQMSVQLVKPGEVAECHRHTAAALRFVVMGHGAYTVVEGERFSMAPADLVLTPNWTWHDHTNNTDEPIIWLDVLDTHLAKYLDASFLEQYPASSQPITKPDGISRWGLGLTRPRQAAASNEAPPFNYKWQDTQAALEALAGGEGDPFDGVLLEYTNPLTGGHTMPTINCQIQMLRPGEATGVHRHTSSTIYHCVRGSGVTTVDELGLEWGEKDCFFVPSWRWHSHRNPSNTQPAILFSVSDRPVLEAIGLYRVEER